MSEAIMFLKALYAKILSEVWANPEAKRSVLTGIKMSITRLEAERDESDDRSLQDAGY